MQNNKVDNDQTYKQTEEHGGFNSWMGFYIHSIPSKINHKFIDLTFFKIFVLSTNTLI